MVDCIKNIQQRHPIARPLGRGMGCLLWIQALIDILPRFLQWCVQYLVILDRVLTALDCIRGKTSIDVEKLLKFHFFAREIQYNLYMQQWNHPGNHNFWRFHFLTREVYQSWKCYFLNQVAWDMCKHYWSESGLVAIFGACSSLFSTPILACHR